MATPHYLNEALKFLRSEPDIFFFPVSEKTVQPDIFSYRKESGPFGTYVAELMRKQHLLEYNVSQTTNIFPSINAGKIKYTILRCENRNGEEFTTIPCLHIFAQEQIETIIREHPGSHPRIFYIDMDKNLLGISECENLTGKETMVVLVNFDESLDHYEAIAETTMVPPPHPPMKTKCYINKIFILVKFNLFKIKINQNV